MTACTLGGPARVNVTACGTGTGAGGGGAHLVACHSPERSSRLYLVHANHVRSTVMTTSRSWCCEKGCAYRSGTRARSGSASRAAMQASSVGVGVELSSRMMAREGTPALESM